MCSLQTAPPPPHPYHQSLFALPCWPVTKGNEEKTNKQWKQIIEISLPLTSWSLATFSSKNTTAGLMTKT